MAEPSAREIVDSDELQELKEAVCDAVLERTRRVVSGEGVHGRIVVGDRPSRVLASGFVLPQRNADGDDESSDIRIGTHGMDLRLRMNRAGAVDILPSFAVYVRALPSSEELFARNGRLVPPADFSAEAKKSLAAKIRAGLSAQPKSDNHAARLAARDKAARAAMIELGVSVPVEARVVGMDDVDEEPTEGNPSSREPLQQRLRIPSAISRSYQVPQKWIRIEVEAPPLHLPLPSTREAWLDAASAHATTLIASAKAACTSWLTSVDGKLWAWRAGSVPSEAFWSPAAWDEFLTRTRTLEPDPHRLIPDFDIRILVDPLPDALEEDVVSVRIAIENLKEGHPDLESGLFGASLEVRIAEHALIAMKLERVRRSYHLGGFLSMPAVGVNGGVEDRGVHNGSRVLRTTWMPRYVLPRMRATSIPSLPTSYERLMNPIVEITALHELTRQMTEWITTVEGGTPLFWPGEDDRVDDEAIQAAHFRDDLDAWRRECTRISKGIDLLARSQSAWREDRASVAALPYQAWLLLNSAFAAANPDRNGEPPRAWRLFQLAFVLAHVPTLASRVSAYEGDFDANFDEDAASLLYMSTGGGKTEAFFGTIVYALFLDRLRGKQRGVTVMMHYPLRLLTIQQAQRLARLLSKAELVRREANVGGAAFEIGFWVGGSNTPNQTEFSGKVSSDVECIPTLKEWPIGREQTLVERDKVYVAARDAWNKLPACPFCSSVTGLRRYPARHHRLGIVCTGTAACPWNAAHASQGELEPLPFLFTDSDIYRRAPSVLLGTIDKLALIGQSTHTINRIAGMFGMARFVEGGDDGLLDSPDRNLDVLPEGFRRLAPSWVDGLELFFDPFPSLIVQDEMHLLDESLGTFGGIFETALFAWFDELAKLLGARVRRVPGAPDKPRLPHVIGATATAANATKHIGALYQKRVVQFPHPGPSILGGFYVRLDDFSQGSNAFVARTSSNESLTVHPREREAAAPWARVYASLMTNGRLHTVTTLAVLSAHAATITRWLRDLTSEQSRRSRAAQEILENVSTALWSERRRAAIANQIERGGYQLLARLVDLHRIELTYVTNKKGGDQILSAIDAEVTEAHDAMGPEYALSGFKMELISGGVDVKGIQAIIQAAEEKFDPATDDVAESLRGIVATSAISHGVDVETFNAMAFAGMPSDIAEYIQASSRVGRRHVGFSLLLPTPQARRDRFIVGVHEMFHRLLERMIAPPAIQRWADRAVRRTIPSLIQTWLAGVHYQRAFVRAQVDAKGSVRFPSTVEAVDATFKGLRGPENFEDCLTFVRAAIGISAVTGGPGHSADYYRDLVRGGVDDVRAGIGSGDFAGLLSNFWSNDQNPLRRLRPMTSLRDVDEPGTIHGSHVGLRNKRIDAADLSAAMALLRNRGISRRRLSPRSETDGEE